MQPPKKWCAAVSNLGRYGQWAYAICGDEDADKYAADLRGILKEHSSDLEKLPFEIVDAATGTPWSDCVPLISLRTAAAKPNSQQFLADGAWNVDLINWIDHPPFEEGMFVAKVHGSAMDPAIPSDSYCLFRTPVDEAISGKIVFVKHSAVHDPHTSGNWTVRRFEKVEAEQDDENWTHDRIELQPDNFEYPTMTLELKTESDLEILGEFVCAISSPEPVDADLVSDVTG